MQLASTFIISLAALVLASASDVIVGTGKNFDKIVTDNPFVVAEFYAPWCGHCKTLEPEYAKAATELKNDDPTITLVKVDATEDGNKALAEKHDINGYPTIKIFRDGDLEKPEEYNGPRDSDGIVNFLRKKAGPASKELTSKAEVEALKTKDPAIIGVFGDGKSSEFILFSKTASKLAEDYDFGHTFEKNLIEDVSTPPSIVMYKDDNAKTVTYDGKYNAKDLEAWLEAQAAPLLPELDQNPKNRKAVNKAFGSQKPKVFGFIAKADKQRKKYVEQLTAAAEKDIGELYFILVDPSQNSQALDYFGLKESDAPAFVVHQGSSKYVSKNAAAKDLHKFLKDFKAGKLEKVIKSEDPPTDNTGPVTIVTANTFDEIVLSGKDVLIEFYAPWCGHCKKLEPTFEKVGQAFSDNDSVIIAKMDATANDVPNDKFEVKGFPTIIFVSAKDGAITEYSGDRSEDDLTQYIKEHASKAGITEDHSEL